jgi:hypothetical protein
MEKMDKFTHPIELSDEELDLVAAGCGGGCGCGCDPALVSVEIGDITLLNNIAVGSSNFRQSA